MAKGKNTQELTIKEKLSIWLISFEKYISLLIILMLVFFSQDMVFLVSFFALFGYLIFNKRDNLFYHFLIASAVSFSWGLVAREMYAYNRQYLTFFNINLYPLFAWAVGLFVIYSIYTHFRHHIRNPSYLKNLFLFALVFWFVLISFETMAYHLLGIHNTMTASYSGLPICDCIHAPHWMQAVYLLLGPLYFTICFVIGLEKNKV